MRVLLLGTGGREHALAWKIAQSPLLEKLYAIPGNPGIAEHAECYDSVDVENHQSVLAFCQEKRIDLVVIGPEAPLVSGLSDFLRQEGVDVFGPSRLAAQLEGSKSFTKNLCSRFGIPTADFRCFTDPVQAKDWVKASKYPLVVKADGLAAGKGVTVALTCNEALEAVDLCFSGAFGESGKEIVIEEFLEGQEVSFFCLCVGDDCLPFGSAQDHKRLKDGNLGPNTGGMGAFSPSLLMTPDMTECVMKTIIRPSLAAMVSLGTPFSGILFAGLMITEEGPKLIEYNVRFGDPECQVLMMRLEDDLLPFLSGCAQGNLPENPPSWMNNHALCVVMVAQGYPEKPLQGSILSIPKFCVQEGVQIFHAGTALQQGKLIAKGGRVLNVAAKAKIKATAREKAYDCLEKISWPEGFYRKDIGL